MQSAPPKREGPGPLAGSPEAKNVHDLRLKLPLIVRWRNAVCAQQSTLTSTQRLVALALSLYANQDGGRCHPSEEALAIATGLTTRSVRSSLARIEQEGLAERRMIKGEGQAWRWTLWTLRLPEGAECLSLPNRKGAEPVSAAPGEGPESDDSKVRNVVPEGPEPVSAYVDIHVDKGRREKAPAPSSADSGAERFDDFWKAYPRKAGSKQKARASWVRQQLDSRADSIIANVVDRAANDQQWTNPTYIPHPTTFLNQERWNDEWTPATKRPSAADRFTGKTYEGSPDDELPAWAH